MRTHQQAMGVVHALATLTSPTHEEVIATYLRERGILADGAESQAAPIPADWTPPAAKALQDEVTYWRSNACATLRTAMALEDAALAKGNEDRAAEIRVGTIYPTRAALAQAIAGDIYWPLCEGCGKHVQQGEAVFIYEGMEVAHVDCAAPVLPDPLCEGARRWDEGEDYSPEGIARTLAEAQRC